MKELAFVILTCVFLSSAGLTEENIRCLLFLRGAGESIKPSAAVLKELFIKLITDICSRIFTKECSRVSTEAAA